MQNLIWVLILVSMLGFVLAVVGALLQMPIMGISPEGFSRTCNNLVLIAIALWLVSQKKANKD
jgi:hypothetical protein